MSVVSVTNIRYAYMTYRFNRKTRRTEQQQGGKLGGAPQVCISCETYEGQLRTEWHQKSPLILWPWDLGVGTLVLGQY